MSEVDANFMLYNIILNYCFWRNINLPVNWIINLTVLSWRLLWSKMNNKLVVGLTIIVLPLLSSGSNTPLLIFILALLSLAYRSLKWQLKDNPVIWTTQSRVSLRWEGVNELITPDCWLSWASFGIFNVLPQNLTKSKLCVVNVVSYEI